jgi:hypothetical protein
MGNKACRGLAKIVQKVGRGASRTAKNVGKGVGSLFKRKKTNQN